MSKEKLTEKHVKKAFCPPSSACLDLYDGNGLALRVSRNGVKIWRYRYESDGTKKTLTLGSYPELNLREARKQRDKALILRKAGIDHSPVQKVFPVSVPDRESSKEASLKISVTFKDVVDEYVKTLDNKPSKDEVNRALYKDLVPVWGMRPSESISLRECVLLLDSIAKRAPVLANLLYAYVKRAYVVSIQRGLITVNPLANLQKPAPKAEIRNNGNKVLTHTQLRTLVQSIREQPSSIMDDVLMMILWTGARPSEVLKMQWKQIEGDQWTLGPNEHKGGYHSSRHIVRPLNDAAKKILNKYKELNSQYVFPGKYEKPSSHIRLSRHVRDIRKCYGIKVFTPNHLRHTISTRMREIGIRPDIVERIIGHHVDTGIVGVYSSYNWFPEMKEALIRWELWIQGNELCH
ncbi:tyrosine-type recombinase/integrase [Candidatus Roizmanbacteria bacterium]|nr:tyrosine-type recombinase/integrase [Candidatus Roizmanbacteria bacterium]